MIQVKLLTDDNQVQITAYRDVGVAKTQVNGREIYFYNERSMRTDCHGLTFTEGKYWVDNDQVDTILKHDSYKELNPSDRVRVGDVAVYRDNNGNVVHTATVTRVDSKGKATQVEGIGGIEFKSKATAPKEQFPNSHSHARRI